MEHLTDHFYWEEVTQSSTASRAGIDNSLPEELKPVVAKTAVGMEML